ncbi:MAG: hypothetical protein ACFNS5_00835, partial [Prevotella melaninogenica]
AGDMLEAQGEVIAEGVEVDVDLAIPGLVVVIIWIILVHHNCLNFKRKVLRMNLIRFSHVQQQETLLAVKKKSHADFIKTTKQLANNALLACKRCPFEALLTPF